MNGILVINSPLKFSPKKTFNHLNLYMRNLKCLLFKPGFRYRITILICVYVLRIHDGYFVVKKQVLDGSNFSLRYTYDIYTGIPKKYRRNYFFFLILLKLLKCLFELPSYVNFQTFWKFCWFQFRRLNWSTVGIHSLYILYLKLLLLKYLVLLPILLCLQILLPPKIIFHWPLNWSDLGAFITIYFNYFKKKKFNLYTLLKFLI